jgi:hypothetical protein
VGGFHTVNIGQIEEAAHRGFPFSMKVADGDRYDVPHRDYLFLPPKESLRRRIWFGVAVDHHHQPDLPG